MPPQDQMPIDSMNMNQTPHSSMNKSVVLLIVAFVVLLVISVYMMKWSGVFVPQKDTVSTQSKPTYTQDKVIVKSVDVTKQGPAIEKIPAVFSKNIPLAKDAVITESNVTEYVEKGITQSMFSYNTTLTQKEVYAIYDVYMVKAKYIFGVEGKKPDTFLFGVKNKDDLSVVIGSNGKDTSVTVVFLDRK